ncbi:MAG: preprotein translocase subunit SecG [Planctomycetaceae bacterium]|nr:preprotein translocase subunit SecG [Planctomycetaceae bacterium]
MAQFISYVMLLLLSFLSFLLIVIVLLQRGRGGGLAGALGGAGGQSAFGTKAGDVFTKITVGLALIWVLVAGMSINILSWSQSTVYSGGSEASDELIRGDADKENLPPVDRPAADLGPETNLPSGADAPAKESPAKDTEQSTPGAPGTPEKPASDPETSQPKPTPAPESSSPAPTGNPSATEPQPATGTPAADAKPEADPTGN